MRRRQEVARPGSSKRNPFTQPRGVRHQFKKEKHDEQQKKTDREDGHLPAGHVLRTRMGGCPYCLSGYLPWCRPAGSMPGSHRCCKLGGRLHAHSLRSSQPLDGRSWHTHPAWMFRNRSFWRRNPMLARRSSSGHSKLLRMPTFVVVPLAGFRGMRQFDSFVGKTATQKLLHWSDRGNRNCRPSSRSERR